MHINLLSKFSKSLLESNTKMLISISIFVCIVASNKNKWFYLNIVSGTAIPDPEAGAE